MFLVGSIADTFAGYERAAPIKFTCSSIGLIAGIETYPSASASGCHGSKRRIGGVRSGTTAVTATPRALKSTIDPTRAVHDSAYGRHGPNLTCSPLYGAPG